MRSSDGHSITVAGLPSLLASPGRVNLAWLRSHAGVSRPALACSAAGVRPACMKAGGCLGYVSRKDCTTVRAGHGVPSAGLSEVTQSALSDSQASSGCAPSLSRFIQFRIHRLHIILMLLIALTE
jgi:hypothetical protein